MPLERGELGERPVLEPAPNFENLRVLQGLYSATRDLEPFDGNRLSTLLGLLQLERYVAPPGEAIEIYPHGESREIPLSVDILSPEDGTWSGISPTSDLYERHVRRRDEFDRYFLGRSVEIDPLTALIFVYDRARKVRVLVEHETKMRRVGVTMLTDRRSGGPRLITPR